MPAMDIYELKPQNSLKGTKKLSTTPNYDVKFEREIYLPNASYFSKNLPKMNEAQQSERNSDEKENIPKLIRNFLGYTTAHGFSRLEGSEGVFWKIFWALVCVGSFGMFTYQVRGLFLLYLSRPVTTSVRITFEKQVPFPAVTICNLNMLRTKEIPKELKEEMLNLVGVYNTSSASNSTKARKRRDIAGSNPPPTTTPTTKSLTTYSDAVGGTQNPPSPSPSSPKFGTFHTTKKPEDPAWYRTTSRPYTTWNPWQQTSYRPYSHRPSHGLPYNEYKDADREYLPTKDEINENVLFLERFTTAVTKVPIEILRPAGHQWEDLVTECTWRGYDCKN
ncbi:degenerin deg-1-like, partial [Paramuricea clavata]